MMADVVFGMKYNLLSSPANRFVCDSITRSNVRTSVLLYLPQLALGRLDKRLFPDSIKARNKLIKFISKVIMGRYQIAAPKGRDVFSHLVSAKDPETGKGLDMTEIGAESTTLIIAGESPTISSSHYAMNQRAPGN